MREQSLFDCYDRVFWFGDMNYRVDQTREQMDDWLHELDALDEQNDPALFQDHYNHLIKNHDQLAKSLRFGYIFQGFREAPISFRPTYKFDNHTDVYDTSQKRRIPAWTDRILYYSQGEANGIICHKYRAATSLRASDHRPVCLQAQSSPESQPSCVSLCRV